MDELSMYPRWARFLEHLHKIEGRGDDSTDVPTGLAGMTKGTYANMRKKIPGNTLPEIPDSYWSSGDKRETYDPHVLRASRAYTNEIYSDYMNPDSKSYLEGFELLPNSAQDFVISSAYNMGKDFHVDTPKERRMPSFKAAVKAGDAYEAGVQLLDTAQVDGQSSKGVAVRRAKEFNALADQLGRARINRLVASDDGIRYFGKSDDGEDYLISSILKPLHKTNRAGSIDF
jgi:hypothetical protein